MSRKITGPVTSVTTTFDDPVSGSMQVGNTGTPLSSASVSIFGVAVQNDHDSSVAIYVGGPFRQDWRLDPGESVSLGAGNLSRVLVRTDGGFATVRFIYFLADS